MKIKDYLPFVLSVVFLVGCSLVSTKVPLSPPLPYTAKPVMSITNFIQPIINPPKPINVEMTVWTGTNNLTWCLYLQSSTNMIDWKTERTFIIDDSTNTVTLTNMSPFAVYRTGW